MKTKEEIIILLSEKFDYVYCDTCHHNNKGSSLRCDECHRKYMNWCISEDFVEQLADEILK